MGRSGWVVEAVSRRWLPWNLTLSPTSHQGKEGKPLPRAITAHEEPKHASHLMGRGWGGIPTRTSSASPPTATPYTAPSSNAKLSPNDLIPGPPARSSTPTPPLWSNPVGRPRCWHKANSSTRITPKTNSNAIGNRGQPRDAEVFNNLRPLPNKWAWRWPIPQPR